MRRTMHLTSLIISLSAVSLGRFSDIRYRRNKNKQKRLLRSAVGWLVRAEYVSGELLAAASWAGAAAGAAVGTAIAAGSTATRVAAAGEAAATVAAAKAIPVAAVVVVRRRHRGDGIGALPRARFKLQEGHPWSCYV